AAAGRRPGAGEIHGYVLLARTDLPGADHRLASILRTVTGLLATPDQGPVRASPVGGVPDSWDRGALARFAVIGDAQACAARLEEYRRAGLECAVLLPSGMRDLHLSGR